MNNLDICARLDPRPPEMWFCPICGCGWKKEQDAVEHYKSHIELEKLATASLYITVGRAAELIGVSPDTLRKWGGTLLKVWRTPGGHRRYKESDVVAFIRGSSFDPQRLIEGEVDRTTELY